MNTHEWIQIDPNYREELALKEKLLNSHRRYDIFICKDEAYGGAMETLQMLIEHLPNQYPNMFQRNHSRTKITNLITGQTFSLTEPDHKHPLEIASLLVQEDLVIMQRPANEDTYYANVRKSFFLMLLGNQNVSGISCLFPIGMAPEIQIRVTISIRSYATCTIFPRETKSIDG